MASKSYEIGAAFERRCQGYFEDLGYFVMRSAGSHSPIDLMCIGQKDLVRTGLNDEKVLVQCRTNAVISKAQVLVLSNMGKKYGCRVLLVYKTDKGHIEVKNLYKEESDV